MTLKIGPGEQNNYWYRLQSLVKALNSPSKNVLMQISIAALMLLMRHSPVQVLFKTMCVRAKWRIENRKHHCFKRFDSFRDKKAERGLQMLTKLKTKQTNQVVWRVFMRNSGANCLNLWDGRSDSTAVWWWWWWWRGVCIIRSN